MKNDNQLSIFDMFNEQTHTIDEHIHQTRCQESTKRLENIATCVVPSATFKHSQTHTDAINQKTAEKIFLLATTKAMERYLNIDYMKKDRQLQIKEYKLAATELHTSIWKVGRADINLSYEDKAYIARFDNTGLKIFSAQNMLRSQTLKYSWHNITEQIRYLAYMGQINKGDVSEAITLNEDRQKAYIKDNHKKDQSILDKAKAKTRAQKDELFGKEALKREDEKRDLLQTVMSNSSANLNFQITEEDFGVYSPKLRYQKNIAAIKCLEELEKSGMQATKEQQAILACFSGFGALPEVFDAENKNWQKEYSELKETLTDSEYQRLRASVLNAHFTPPLITRSVWQVLKNLGFSGGNILEPAVGIGNFIGTMPSDILSKSNVYGQELEPLSASIASQLYQSAKILTGGFETSELEDDVFDVAISNVPFGNYKVFDRQYNKENLLIHDYFFVKALDKVRPGGVVAFITSIGTLDKQNSKARELMAQKADLLGAIRLPAASFRANAGTDVATDIIFLQKRQSAVKNMPEWVYTNLDKDGILINNYFLSHPDQILGYMTTESSYRMYGNKDAASCVLGDGQDLHELLAKAIQNIDGQYIEAEADEELDEELDDKTKKWEGKNKSKKNAPSKQYRRQMPASVDVKDYSHTLVNGEIFFRQGSKMYECIYKEQKDYDLVKDAIWIRQCLGELIAIQKTTIDDKALKPLQVRLGLAYDAFVKTHGHFVSEAVEKLLEKDSTYPMLLALEEVDSSNKFKQKSEIFYARTISATREITHADSATEALYASISEHGYVDLDWMETITNIAKPDLISELEKTSEIFFDPEKDMWVIKSEYLSGNVRSKLTKARSALVNSKQYQKNCRALEEVLPADIAFEDITFRLGTSWIDATDIKKFIIETLKLPFWLRDFNVSRNTYDNSWSITNKPRSLNLTHEATEIYGTQKLNALEIIERALNSKPMTIKIPDDLDTTSSKMIVDVKATELAKAKLDKLNECFRHWLWQDNDRKQRYVRRYNDTFNCLVERSYDGQNITLPLSNPQIELKSHQKNAVARMLFSKNTLLAHTVGAGKTFSMIAAAQKMKQIGMAKKPLVCVPKPVINQWAKEYMRLYPQANILVTTEKDFIKENRLRLTARIATGNWDCVIMTHDQLQKIKCSKQAEAKFIEDELSRLERCLTSAKQTGEQTSRITIKRLEKAKARLQVKIKELLAEERKDDLLTFEDLGIDALFVDEAHKYKSLGIQTSMVNVSGLSSAQSQRALDMLLKCRLIQEKNAGRGVVFATGTPITNTMCELYNLMRFLQPEDLQSMDIESFDSWASVFGQTTQVSELRPEGRGYIERTRFSKFYNLPELMTLFKQCADIKTASELDLSVPEAEFITVKSVCSAEQKQSLDDLCQRAEKIRQGSVDPRLDNMLKVTNDGRKLALDIRLIDEDKPADSQGKIAKCAKRAALIYHAGKEEKTTQVIFCDMGVPKKKGEEGFSVYQDIKMRLIDGGVAAQDIAFVHDAKSEEDRAKLFAKVNDGEIRIIIGSTEKLGTGVNIQERLIASHDLDCPWRPADLEQRAGRIIRQGNNNKKVEIYRYITENTFDAYMWQTQENKQRFITQVMTSKSALRATEDVDEAVLSAAEIKALATGNPLIKEKMDLEVEITRLKMLFSEHKRSRHRIKELREQKLPRKLSALEEKISCHTKDAELGAINTFGNNEFCIEITNRVFTGRTEANKAIGLLVDDIYKSHKTTHIGTYRGFALTLSYVHEYDIYSLSLMGSREHSFEFTQTDSPNFCLRMDNQIAKITYELDEAKKSYQETKEELARINEIKEAPFEHAGALAIKETRLEEINTALQINCQISESQTENNSIEHEMSGYKVIKEPLQENSSFFAHAR
jgi:N12 class adenine-specific DNA methylase